MRFAFLVLGAATTVAALRAPMAAAPALRHMSQPRRAAVFLAAEAEPETAEVAPDTTSTEEIRGVVVPTKSSPMSSPMLRNGAFAAVAVAAAVIAFKPSLFAGVAACGSHIGAQVAYEISHCTASPAKLFGFIGACCNWFLGASAVYDALNNGPEIISLQQTIVMLGYSIIFARWAGWAVMPRNYVLAGSHMLNIAAQSNQLRRCLMYQLETGGEKAKKEIKTLGVKMAAALAAIAGFISFAPAAKAAMPVGSYLASAGGPFTIHPWPPVTKFFLSLTSLTDLQRPVEKISLSQYAALTLTGFIFTFYGLFVTPINYALTGVNILLFASSGWHLARKLKACMTWGECDVEDAPPATL